MSRHVIKNNTDDKNLASSFTKGHIENRTFILYSKVVPWWETILKSCITVVLYIFEGVTTEHEIYLGGGGSNVGGVSLVVTAAFSKCSQNRTN